MGQKVNPNGFRLPLKKNWQSKWFNSKNYTKWLHEDLRIKEKIEKEFQHASLGKIDIERFADKIKVIIHTAKPGMVVGRKGVGIDRIKEIAAGELTGISEIHVEPMEIKKAELNAKLVADDIVQQIKRRAHFRRVVKNAVSNTMKSGALGIKVQVSGRLGGADMSRVERYHEGKIPLQTMRADIDYGFSEADTTYGSIGVKVWITRK
ncbi:MAG: 30S ribosomal protein S3 [bacterium]